MKVSAVELSRMEKTRDVLYRMAGRTASYPTAKTEELHYRFLGDYFQDIIEAKTEGKLLIGHSVLVPPELIVAMDMVPIHLEIVAGTVMPVILREVEGFLARAKSYGLTPEVCSTHRLIAAASVEGWLPRPDAVIWSNQVCDNTAKSNELVVECYGSLPLYYDCPYERKDRAIQYLAQELEEVVHGLEWLGGHRLDIDRLREVLRTSERMVSLIRDCHEMRKVDPSPGWNTLGTEALCQGWCHAGQPRGLTFFQTMRDELADKKAQGTGFVPKQNYRLLSEFIVPTYNWSLLRWMEQAHGAVVVAETYCTHWGDIQWDYERPFYTLAQLSYAHPICWTMHGPVAEGLVEKSLQDAQTSRADGAIYWAHIGCRQTCATIRTLKDAFAQQADLPLLSLDVDLNDPTYVSNDDLKERLEGFFEVLEGRR